MPGKSKREIKKEKEIKEENIRKLDAQIKESKKIPKDYKKKMNKQLLLNVITVIVMVLYLACINILSLYLDTTIYLRYIKIVSVILAVISVVYFEFGYRKDNGKLFLYGVEVLILAIITLFSNYAYYMYFDRYNIILAGITGGFALYYLIKILIVRRNLKKQYYKDINDIKDIVKKFNK